MLGMGLRVKQTQRATPGSAEDHVPFGDAEVLSEPLDILGQMLCRIPFQLVPRAGFPYTSLIPKDDPIYSRVKELGVIRRCGSTGASVEINHY
jgi:hypothetical protein